MLQSFRDNLKGTVATILVVLIIIPFALFGVDSLFVSSAPVNTAAEVNGEKITETELRRAVLLQKQRLEAQMGSNAPVDFFSEERLRDPVLQGLIQRLLLAQQAEQEGMVVPEDVLHEVILSSEQFQEGGKFSAQRYSQLLRNMGYTPAYYKRLLSQDLLLNQHSAGISDSSFVTSQELEHTVALSQQTRDFYYLTIPLAEVEQTTEVSAEEVQQYYEEHQDDFLKPEQVAIEYIDLNANDLASTVEVSNEAIRQQYEQELAAFEAQTQRQVSHILIEPKEDNSEQTLLKELQQRLSDGEDFAELARKYSEDLGTRDQGGDLGLVTSGTFPKAFEKALDKLKVGEVSAPVKTDAGFHLIKLVREEGTEPPTFEQEKGRIARMLRQAEAEAIFVDLLEKLEELSYNAESLKDVADELGVELKTTGLFGRGGGSGITANSKVLNSVFSEEVLQDGNTSGLIELGEHRVVVANVTQHLPATIKPLDEVREQISKQLQHQHAKEQVAALGSKLKTQVLDGQSIEAAAKASNYQWQVNLDTRRNDPKVSRELLQQVFSLPKPADKPVVAGFHLNNGDYVVVSVTKAENGKFEELAPEQKKSLRAQLEGQFGSGDFTAYEALLKQQADIEIY